jgi:TolA-binding protein
VHSNNASYSVVDCYTSLFATSTEGYQVTVVTLEDGCAPSADDLAAPKQSQAAELEFMRESLRAARQEITTLRGDIQERQRQEAEQAEVLSGTNKIVFAQKVQIEKLERLLSPFTLRERRIKIRIPHKQEKPDGE